jgi:uncharacterized protein with NRDE domain
LRAKRFGAGICVAAAKLSDRENRAGFDDLSARVGYAAATQHKSAGGPPMCLLILAYHQLPDVPLFLAANREESTARPSIPPEIVREADGVCWFGGRDGLAGGTWLGVNREGLVVGITNRSAPPAPPDARSRGLLCRELLICGRFADALVELDRQLQRPVYAGFNLLLASWYGAVVVEHTVKNRRRELSAGLHVLTNSGLNDAGDPRGERAAREFQAGVESDPSLPSLLSVAKRICRSTELAPHAGRDGRISGTVSASIIALPADPATAEYHYAPGPPSRTEFESHSAALREMMKDEG